MTDATMALDADTLTEDDLGAEPFDDEWVSPCPGLDLLEDAKCLFMHAPVSVEARYLLAALLVFMSPGPGYLGPVQTGPGFDPVSFHNTKLPLPDFEARIEELVEAGLIEIVHLSEEDVRGDLLLEVELKQAALETARQRGAPPRVYRLSWDALSIMDS